MKIEVCKKCSNPDIERNKSCYLCGCKETKWATETEIKELYELR